MSKMQAVIFDRDGVLTYFDMRAVMAYFLPLLAIPLEELTQRWWAWRDLQSAPGSVAAEQIMFEGFWNVLADDLNLTSAQREKLHQFDYTTVVCAFPDATATLQAIKARGLKVGVLSNFELASIDASLQAAGLAEWVDAALAAPVIGVAKPDPGAYLAAARALEVAPETCIYIDDEAAWADGARAVGMAAYWLDRQATQHDLARYVLRDLTFIPKVLEQANTSS
ncbi:MAG: HAD-IA family hydrolase [Anaerolineae bacterium]|nr:HAD-IA family hydrolase [Anaerolineae bacterium]